ncbi:MAG: PPC domain-containing protein [Cyanobacteriota bacterium]|nr:PPC domain-containing protein [Cyanobacteriota bacterium]
MDNIFDEKFNSLGQKFSDPMLAGIDGVSDELRLISSIESSAESSELKIENLNTGNDDLLLPQNPSEAFNLGQDGDEVSETSLELGKDILTNDTNSLTVGAIDSLTGVNSERVEIQSRSYGGSDLLGNSQSKADEIGELNTDSVSNSDRNDTDRELLQTKFKSQLRADETDKGGNTLDTARNLGTLKQKQQKISDFIGTSDPNDYYQFKVDGDGAIVNLTLKGLKEDATLILYDSSGNWVTGSYNEGAKNESINRALDRGTYYAHVYYNFGANTDYNLTLKATPISPDSAGNTLNSARDIGTLKKNQNFRDFVGSIDGDDYYKFKVDGGGAKVNLTLQGLSDNATLLLYDSSGKRITGSYNEGIQKELISTTLAADTYYANVSTFYNGGDTKYNLVLKATPISPDSAGNTLNSARDIGTLKKNQNFRDFVGSIDGDDYYKFKVKEDGTILNLSLQGLGDNADVLLYQSGREYPIASSYNDGKEKELITEPLKKGTYYTKVFSPYDGGDTKYNLVLKTQADGAGNSKANARNLGTLNGNKSSSDLVSSFAEDSDDYYRFKVKNWTNLALDLKELQGDANLELLDKKGNVVASSTKAGTKNESINSIVKPGNYYARVKIGWGETDYKLKLSAKAAPTNLVSINNLSFSGKEGDEGTFQVRLNKAPKSKVTLKFDPSNFLTLDADNDIRSGPQDSITFTRSNWNQARTVSFIAEKDDSNRPRKSGNTIDYVLSGGLKGGGTYDVGKIANTYAPDNNNFNIDLDFRTDYLGYWTPKRREIAQQAADDWARLIDNELKGLKLENQTIWPVTGDGEKSFEIATNQFIDDMVVFVGAYGNDDWGGRGGPRIGGYSQSDPLVRVGSITVNSSIYSTTDSYDSLYSTVSHEIGHALGIMGLNYASKQLISGGYFTGKYTREFNGGKNIAIDGGHPDHDLESQMSYHHSGYTVTELDKRLLADSGYKIYGVNAKGQPRPMSEFGKLLEKKEEEQADDFLTGANDVGTLGSKLRRFNGFLGDIDPRGDYYRFEVGSSGGTLKLNLNGLSGDVNVALRNSDNDWIDGSYNSGNQAESIGVPLVQGTYYVDISFPWDSEEQKPIVKDTDYKLTLKLT